MIKIPYKLSTTILSKVYNSVNIRLKDLFHFLPRQCLLCRSTIYKVNICQYCDAALPRLENYCNLCHWPIPLQMDSCMLCVSGDIIDLNKIDINLQIALNYVHPINKLIQQFKYKGDLIIGELLAELLVKYLQANHTLQPYKPEVIIPVPIHKSKLKTRGFNQGTELARCLSKHFSIPLDTDLVAKYKNTKSQMGHNRDLRRANLDNSLCLNYRPSYKSVVIIDDVITTGSTIRAMINLLYKANIRKISIWAVARRV